MSVQIVQLTRASYAAYRSTLIKNPCLANVKRMCNKSAFPHRQRKKNCKPAGIGKTGEMQHRNKLDHDQHGYRCIFWAFLKGVRFVVLSRIGGRLILRMHKILGGTIMRHGTTVRLLLDTLALLRLLRGKHFIPFQNQVLSLSHPPRTFWNFPVRHRAQITSTLLFQNFEQPPQDIFDRCYIFEFPCVACESYGTS